MRPRLLACTLACLAAGCGGGGGDDDEARVEQVLRDFATAVSENDGEKLCGDLVTQEFIERTTFASGEKAREQCVEEIENVRGADFEVREIESIEIDGDRATATADFEMQGRRGRRDFRFERVDGEFRLSDGL